MATFIVPVASEPTPQQVSDAIYASAVVDPQAFVLLVTDSNHLDGHVTVFHCLQHHEPRLGHPTPFDGAMPSMGMWSMVKPLQALNGLPTPFTRSMRL